MENETIKEYLSSIKNYPLLSAEEEQALSKKIQKGDKAALQKLINSNLRLVLSVAKKMKTSQSNIMDLIQEGNMGLMIAAQKFSSAFKTRFSTYAYPWIAQYMLRFLNTKSSFITLPHRKELIIRKIQNAQAYFFQQHGREQTVQELALFLGLEEEKVIEYLSYSYTVASLDIEANDEGSSATIGDLIADNTYNPEELLARNETKEYIRSMMSKLSKNEQTVLWYRYNLDGDMHTKTLREISKIIGVSPEAVRQTEIRAVKHMKQLVSNY
jgi:RNA polymerase primary sigma factor